MRVYDPQVQDFSFHCDAKSEISETFHDWKIKKKSIID
jgi:hypothetical protein